MRTLLLIGIGAGNPAHLTLEAVAALARVQVILILDKGQQKQQLTDIRKHLCDRHIPHPYCLIEAEDPVRDDTIPDYPTRVLAWHRARVALLDALLLKHVAENETAAILVWGDPSLYDSTLRIVAELQTPLIINVLPGITSLQALAAAHQIPLHGIGESVLITPARKLSDTSFDHAENIVVMLDGEQAFTRLTLPNLHIWWGAYVGMKQQILITGDLTEVAPAIQKARAEARALHGWIMDIYLIRKDA